mmetsp:Transcript_23014/g.26394  ORF Transcript_23014/g.26394 Transcript_23014/m.26394 type:complete len:87 (+) Transcript_23014:74-334(+)
MRPLITPRAFILKHKDLFMSRTRLRNRRGIAQRSGWDGEVLKGLILKFGNIWKSYDQEDWFVKMQISMLDLRNIQNKSKYKSKTSS